MEADVDKLCLQRQLNYNGEGKKETKVISVCFPIKYLM